MIGPSRRQLPTSEPRDPFALHRRFSARRYWQQRLLACSVSALAFSLVAWALSLPLGYHALATLVGFAVGFAWRVPETSPWALSWIEQQTGYSYRTALELPGDDPYGFAPAVRARAATTVRRVEPPPLQPWWLPILALALGLLLFPALNLVTPTPTTSGTPITANGGSAPGDPAPSPLPSETETELAEEPDGLPDTPDGAPLEMREPDRRDADEAQFGEGELASESAALQRALEQLRERSSERERLAEGEAREAAISESEENEFDGEALAREQRADQASQPSREEADEGEGGEDDGDGERAASGEESQAGDEAGEGEGQGEQEGEGGEMQQAADPDASPGGDAPSDEPADGPAPNDGLEEGLADSDDEGLSAGNLPSPPSPVDEELPQASEREREHLDGVIGEGPRSVGGEILLPPISQEGGPSGPAAQAAERALEQAITEGRIPVEYQEILRSYFR